jgi:hypothetical protein
MRLFEYIKPNNSYKEKLRPGDFVQGSFRSDDNVVTGVYIHQSGSYHHLVAIYKPGTGKTAVWANLYNVEKIDDEGPSDLLRYAQKNPYWGAKPGEKITMRTNI